MRLVTSSRVSLLLAFSLALAWALPGQAAAPGKAAPKAANQLEPLIKTLRSVSSEGKGHREATAAWQQLTKADVDQLPTILAGMDGAGPLAENWLRAAVDTIAERQVQQTGKLPLKALEKFLAQTQHNPRARRLTYEWIARVDKTAPDRLIPGMLDDPSLELRRDAVALIVTAADKAVADGKPDDAKNEYRKALSSARDLDQVKAITEALGKLDAPVDLQHHYGFLVDWQLIGPFDNRGGKGFNVAYPPEEGIDLAAKYEGKEGEVAWKAHHTDDEYGTVDLNKAIAKHMGAAGYAVAVFESDREQPIELRAGSENALKCWLNGKQLFETEVYHANSAIDQYVGRGMLKKGRNVILLKVLQDEQTVDWAQSWSFQLRACDASGKAVLATDRGPANPKPKRPAAEATAGQN
jgi:hypothetical protein